MENEHPEQPHVRRRLGELQAMSNQVQETERNILRRAEEMLTEVNKQADELRSGALAGDADAMQRYQQAIEDRGRLEKTIAQARLNLAEA